MSQTYELPRVLSVPMSSVASLLGYNRFKSAIAENNAVMNVEDLVDDKAKFRKWNTRFLNVMADYENVYDPALEKVMKNVDVGRPAEQRLDESITADLRRENLQRDLRFVLADKAEG